jgi:hypothetical protein
MNTHRLAGFREVDDVPGLRQRGRSNEGKADLSHFSSPLSDE